MRLLIIINTTNIGGTEHATLRFIKLLMKRDDIRVTVMSPRPKGIGAVLFREIGFEVIGLPHCGPYGILSNFLLTRRIWTLNPDCIWVVGTSVSSILSTLLSFAKIKVLSIHYHHTGIHGSMFWQLFYVLISRIFDVITYPSNFIRNEAMTFAHYISKQSFVLRNPLINIIRHEGQSHDQGKGNLYIGNAGQLIKRKRWDIFLECCAKVIKESPHVRVVIAGDGPERKYLENMALQLSIHDKIIWLGWVKDLTSFYNKIDILLFNSDADAFPTTPIEAMAYGIPIVASCKWGGISEAIPENKYGMVITDHNVDLLSDHLIKLVNNNTFRLKIGGNGKEYVNRQFGIKNIGKMLMTTFGISDIPGTNRGRLSPGSDVDSALRMPDLKEHHHILR